MPISTLSNDLLAMIIQDQIMPYYTLYCIALTCRRFLPFARAALYSHIEVTSRIFFEEDKELETSQPQDEVAPDEADNEEESEEEQATVQFLDRFDQTSWLLLDTFLDSPELAYYVRSITLSLTSLEDPKDGIRLLETVVAPSANLRRLKVKSLGWGPEEGELFEHT